MEVAAAVAVLVAELLLAPLHKDQPHQDQPHKDQPHRDQLHKDPPLQDQVPALIPDHKERADTVTISFVSR